MPMIDMPIEKLEKYDVVNPKPIDLEEYWDKAYQGAGFIMKCSCKTTKYHV